MTPGRVLIRLAISRDNNKEDPCQVSVSQTLPFFTEEEPKTEEEKGVFRDLANKAIAKLQAAETEVLRVLEEKGISIEKNIISISDESEQSSSDGYKEKKHSHRTSRNKGKKATDQRKRRFEKSSDEESVRKVRRSSRPHARVNYAPEWDKKTGRLLDRKKRLAEEKWALIPVKTSKSSTSKGREKSRETKMASSDAMKKKKKKARTEQHRRDTDEEDKSSSSSPEDEGHSSKPDNQPDGKASKTWADFSKFNNDKKGKDRPELPLSSKRRRAGRHDHKIDKKIKAEPTCRRKGRNPSPSSSGQSSDDVDISSDKDIVETEVSESEGDEEQWTKSEDETGDEENDLTGDGPKMADDSGIALTKKAFAALRSSHLA